MSVATLPNDSLPGQSIGDIQISLARQGTNPDSGQPISDAHTRVAAVGTTSPQAIKLSIPRVGAPAGNLLPDPTMSDPTPIARASGQEPSSAAPAIIDPIPTQCAPGLLDPLLNLAAITLDDLENLRKAQENRYRSLTHSGISENGLEWGYGLDDRDPQVAQAGAMVDAIKALEHTATLNLQRLMRKHPLGPWVKAQPGIGEKQAARLLAAIGDPYWNTLYDRPRIVSELWAYSGLVPGQKRTKGQKSNWSTEAKTRAWLCIESCMKLNGIPDAKGRPRALSPYRAIIDERRAKTAGRVHATPCPRCGPKGKPAPAGSPWSAGHSLADGVRIASKELLKDLWLESRRLHCEVPHE